jgi:hypothetical protein
MELASEPSQKGGFQGGLGNPSQENSYWFYLFPHSVRFHLKKRFCRYKKGGKEGSEREGRLLYCLLRLCGVSG